MIYVYSGLYEDYNGTRKYFFDNDALIRTELNNDWGQDLSFYVYDNSVVFTAKISQYSSVKYWLIKKDMSDLYTSEILEKSFTSSDSNLSFNGLDGDYYLLYELTYSSPTLNNTIKVFENTEQNNIFRIFPNTFYFRCNYNFFVVYKENSYPVKGDNSVSLDFGGSELFLSYSNNNSVIYGLFETLNVAGTYYITTKNVTPPTPTVENIFYSCYRPSNALLSRLADKLYLPQSDGSFLYIGDRILNVSKIFFKIPVLSEDKNIVLGGYDTNILSPTCSNELKYVFTTDFISIKGYYNNYIDYSSDVRLSIKYCGLYSVDIAKILNKKIAFRYIVNIYDNSLICLLIDDNENVIESFNGYCGIKLPYIYNDFKETTYIYDDIPLSIDIVIGDVVTNIYNVDYNNTIDSGIGYFKIDKINSIEFDGTNEEYNLLLQFLSSGVFV